MYVRDLMRLLLLILAACGPSDARALPLRFEFSGFVTSFSPGDFDPGFRSGASIGGVLILDTSDVVLLWTDDFEIADECGATHTRCAYQMPAELAGAIHDRSLEFSGNAVVTASRGSSLVITMEGFSYANEIFSAPASLGISLGYGVGFDPAGVGSTGFVELPPPDFDHFLSIEFGEPGRGAALARITAVPEAPLAAVLALVVAGLVSSRSSPPYSRRFPDMTAAALAVSKNSSTSTTRPSRTR
jgi:hypothetical protein